MAQVRRLHGRRDELAALTAVMADAARGRGGVATVEGEPGIGKSALLAAALQQGAAEVAVHSATAHELDLDRPLSLLIGIVGAPAGDEVAPADAGPDVRLQLLDEAVAAVARSAQESPLVLVLDDLQWADGTSLAVVGDLLRRLPRLPLALLLATRPAPRSKTLSRVLAAARDRGSDLRLAPLSEQEVAALSADLLPDAQAETTQAALARARGNPLFVSALAGLLNAGEPADALPRSLRATVLRTVESLSPRTRDVLFAAAALGTSFAVADLAAVLGRRGSDLLAPLREALEAHVLEDAGPVLCFRHDLVREAVYEQLPQAVRAAFHVEAGHALAARGHDSLTVAGQLALGSGPPQEAVQWLHRAAREVLPSDPAAAAGLLERAAQRLPVPPTELLDDLAWALLWSGRGPECIALVDRALPSERDPSLRCSMRLARAKALIGLGLPEASVAELEAALAKPELPVAARTRLLGELALRRLHLRDFALAEETAVAAQEHGEKVDDVQTVTAALCARSWVADCRGNAQLSLRLARQAAALAARDPSGRARAVNPRVHVALAQLHAERPQEARATLVEALAAPEALWSRPTYEVLLGLCHVVAGDLPEAAAAVTRAQPAEPAVLDLWGQALLALVALHRGELEQTAAHLSAAEDVLTKRGPHHLGTPWLVWARALHDEATGRADQAVQDLAAGWSAAAGREGLGELLDAAPDLCRLAIARGRDDLAHRVVADTARLAEHANSGVARAVAAHCDGLVARDVALLTAAADAYDEAGRGLHAAAAREHAGAACAEPGTARMLLEAAAEGYTAAGATRDGARVAQALREHGVSRGPRGARRRPESGWASLTPTEQVVARLAAQGLTNRAIGSRLFVSPRTVATHLSSTYAKLGLAGRVELAAAVSADPDISVM